MNLNYVKDKPKRLDAIGASTNYNGFHRPNDYNSEAKHKSGRPDGMIHTNSKIDVKLRKKIKTAGDKNTDSLFQNTFGSFNQIQVDSYD